ncbi:MAG: hypothetical protein ABI358_03390 [Ginsengibacter sp.]
MQQGKRGAGVSVPLNTVDILLSHFLHLRTSTKYKYAENNKSLIHQFNLKKKSFSNKADVASSWQVVNIMFAGAILFVVSGILPKVIWIFK